MNSRVLITGAAGGLGKAFAAECASRGWDLFLSDVPGTPLSVLAEGLERLFNVSVLYSPCDLVEPAARKRFWDDIRAQGLQFHFLFNVAGLDFEGPFAERTTEELSRIVRLNVESVVAMTRMALEHRDPTRRLRIVNVSSLAGFNPMPVKAVYAASKRFLLDFSLALRCELRDSEVSVTALCPAGMPTNAPVIKAIERQGVMGRLTTIDVGRVAARTIDKALAGRAVYVPGAVNRALRLLSGLFPRPVVAGFIRRRWMSAKKTGQQPGFVPG